MPSRPHGTTCQCASHTRCHYEWPSTISVGCGQVTDSLRRATQRLHAAASREAHLGGKVRGPGASCVAVLSGLLRQAGLVQLGCGRPAGRRRHVRRPARCVMRESGSQTYHRHPTPRWSPCWLSQSVGPAIVTTHQHTKLHWCTQHPALQAVPLWVAKQSRSVLTAATSHEMTPTLSTDSSLAALPCPDSCQPKRASPARGALVGGVRLLGRLGSSRLPVLHHALQRRRRRHLLVRPLRALLHLPGAPLPCQHGWEALLGCT